VSYSFSDAQLQQLANNLKSVVNVTATGGDDADANWMTPGSDVRLVIIFGMRNGTTEQKQWDDRSAEEGEPGLKETACFPHATSSRRNIPGSR